MEQLAPELAELLHTADMGVTVLVTPAEEATADMAKLRLAVEGAGEVTEQRNNSASTSSHCAMFSHWKREFVLQVVYKGEQVG